MRFIIVDASFLILGAAYSHMHQPLLKQLLFGQGMRARLVAAIIFHHATLILEVELEDWFESFSTQKILLPGCSLWPPWPRRLDVKGVSCPLSQLGASQRVALPVRLIVGSYWIAFIVTFLCTVPNRSCLTCNMQIGAIC